MAKTDRKLADEAKLIPNPGSNDARNLGCACPVMDNHYGTGIPHPNGPLFWINGECELHGQKRTTNEADNA